MLKRRVPQTHLAPQLTRRRPAPTADASAGRGGNGQNGNGHHGNGQNGNGHYGTGQNGNGHQGNGNGNGQNGTGYGNGYGQPDALGHPAGDQPGPAGALSALSQYQASRRAARDALSEDPARGTDLTATHGGDTDTHDGGRS